MTSTWRILKIPSWPNCSLGFSQSATANNRETICANMAPYGDELCENKEPYFNCLITHLISSFFFSHSDTHSVVGIAPLEQA